MMRLLKQTFEPFPKDYVFEDIQDPMPFGVFLGMIVISLFLIVLAVLALASVYNAVTLRYDYLLYPHMFLSWMLAAVTICWMTPVFYFARNIRKRAPTWPEARPYRYGMIFTLIALITTPITSYALGHYVRSNGYERCTTIGGAHLSLLAAHWVRPPLTCEEVDAKTARELREAGWNVR